DRRHARVRPQACAGHERTGRLAGVDRSAGEIRWRDCLSGRRLHHAVGGRFGSSAERAGRQAMTAALASLPRVRGTYTEHAALKDLVWFRAGGPADILFRPADVEDLCAFMAAKPAGLPVTVIGVGSNLLIRDGGIGGVVIRLPGAFGRIEQLGESRLRAGAAALDAAVARAAADAGIAGLEFFRGIPGTIG